MFNQKYYKKIYGFPVTNGFKRFKFQFLESKLSCHPQFLILLTSIKSIFVPTFTPFHRLLPKFFHFLTTSIFLLPTFILLLVTFTSFYQFPPTVTTFYTTFTNFYQPFINFYHLPINIFATKVTQNICK